jgi:hypothetical protein
MSTLFIVRHVGFSHEEYHWQQGQEEGQLHGYYPPGDPGPYDMEGVFASREEALAFRQEREAAVARFGGQQMLLCLAGSADWLMQLSEFDPPVFLDWLVDHDVPPPPAGVGPSNEYNDWLLSLNEQQLIALHAALHRLHSYEVVEVPFANGEFPPEQWQEWEEAALRWPEGRPPPPLPNSPTPDWDDFEIPF